MRKVKYAILGAGSSGLTALGKIRKTTDDFVMINGGAFGTTCARVGCMPSKALIHCAEHFHARKHFKAFGISNAAKLELDDKAVMQRVREFRDRFTGGVQAGTTDTLAPEQLIKGYATFINDNTIEVNGEQIQAERIIIATGSRPVVPQAWKHLGDKLLTSDDIFEVKKLPKKIAVIGLGIIGLELGQALSRLGVEVIGFELSDTIGGLSSPTVAKKAIKCISQEFPIYLGESAELKLSGKSVKVMMPSGTFEVDAVLASLGRRPNLDQLGLENTSLALDDKGMPSFDLNTMQVEDKPIFIAGDVNGYRPILHEAGFEGAVVAKNALNYPDITAYRRKTAIGIAFTDPQIAFFGISYKELNFEKTVIANFKLNRNNGRLIVMGEDKGILALYADKASKQLIGGELFMPRAEHIAHLLTWAIERKLTVLELLKMPFYHPVIEEAVESTLRELAKELYDPKEIQALDVLD